MCKIEGCSESESVVQSVGWQSSRGPVVTPSPISTGWQDYHKTTAILTPDDIFHTQTHGSRTTSTSLKSSSRSEYSQAQHATEGLFLMRCLRAIHVFVRLYLCLQAAGNVSNNNCVLQDRRICDTTLPAPRCMLVFVKGRSRCKGVLVRVPAG